MLTRSLIVRNYRSNCELAQNQQSNGPLIVIEHVWGLYSRHLNIMLHDVHNILKYKVHRSETWIMRCDW